MDLPGPSWYRISDPRYQSAMWEDNRYRDMCVTGAGLTQANFDPVTGEVLARDIDAGGVSGYDMGAYYYDSTPESMTAFDQAFTGRVSGSKPPTGECMPIKDTPIENIAGMTCPSGSTWTISASPTPKHGVGPV